LAEQEAVMGSVSKPNSHTAGSARSPKSCSRSNTIEIGPPQPISKPSSQIRFNAGLFVRSSDTGKILFGITLVFSVFAIVVMRRIWALEMKNGLMEAQLKEYQSTLNKILIHVPMVVPEETKLPTSATDPIPSYEATTTHADTQLRIRRDVPQNRSLPSMGRASDRLHRPKTWSGRKDKDNRRDREARAIYMIPVAPNVDINKSELELIGPWYIGEGSDFGFNDLWYRDISLDVNRTSIIFKESGLHLIYAQVYYHLTLAIGESPAPMGFRIFIQKDAAKEQIIRRPIPIAECVPSYPSTVYQTCFTQVAWYMEEGDQVYLKHYENSFPMIEADRQGKTFLGIVRLSSAQ